MSTEPSDASSAEACVMIETLSDLHHRWLERAQALLVTLEQSDDGSAGAADVHGYLAQPAPGQLAAHERDAMCAQLRTDIRTLQAMTEQLEQVRAAVQALVRA